jgi:AcrR family transcriptional regulator
MGTDALVCHYGAPDQRLDGFDRSYYDSTMNTKIVPSGQKRPTFTETARRAQLIECAIETIATLGYIQASLAQIATSADISKSAITYYFTSKEELIAQVITAIYDDAAAYIGPRIAAQPSATLRLQAYIEAHVEYISAHLTQMMALMEIAVNFRTDDGKLRNRAATAERARAPLEALLRNGQQEGDFRDFDVGVMVGTIRSAIDALPRLLIANPEADAGLYARELVTLFDRATRKE